MTENMSFKPRQTSQLDILGFFLLVTAQAFLSLSVHVGNDNLFSLLAHTASTILCSQLMYSCVTTFQYLKFTSLYMFPSKKTSKNEKKNTDSTVSAILCDSSYFASARSKPTFKLNRGELWRLQYPMAIGVFSFFACLPIFDATCTCSLIFGLLLRSFHHEFVRGMRYHRPISRRVLFFVLMLFGLLSCIVTFAFAFSIGVVSTDDGMQNSLDFRKQHENSLYNEIYEYARNSSSTENITEEDEASATNNDTDILENFIQKSNISNKSFVQYARWTAHSYPLKMSFLWVTFFMAPFFINNVPEKMGRTAAIEIVQVPVSFISTSVLCLISIVISRQPFILLQTDNASGVAYVILSPILTWLCIWKILKYQENKSLYAPTCIILLVTFVKHCVQHQRLLKREIFDEIAICSGILVFMYATLTVIFARLETTAMRMGWGSRTHGDEGHREMGLSDSERGEEEDEDMSFVIEDTVEKILDDAKRDMAAVQSELSEVDAQSESGSEKSGNGH